MKITEVQKHYSTQPDGVVNLGFIQASPDGGVGVSWLSELFDGSEENNKLLHELIWLLRFQADRLEDGELQQRMRDGLEIYYAMQANSTNRGGQA